MLRAVPVEGLDVDEDDPLDDVGFVCGAEGFDEGWSFLIVLVDLDATEDLEASLVGIVHEEQSHARIVLQIAEADVLLVAAQVREADERWVHDTDKALGAAAVLYVGPTGLADGGHVDAVAALDEVLFCRAERVARGRVLRHALVLTAAAMFNLMFFDEGREGQFLEAATH
jgi:hypothetical protein